MVESTRIVGRSDRSDALRRQRTFEFRDPDQVVSSGSQLEPTLVAQQAAIAQLASIATRNGDRPSISSLVQLEAGVAEMASSHGPHPAWWWRIVRSWRARMWLETGHRT